MGSWIVVSGMCSRAMIRQRPMNDLRHLRLPMRRSYPRVRARRGLWIGMAALLVILIVLCANDRTREALFTARTQGEMVRAVGE